MRKQIITVTRGPWQFYTFGALGIVEISSIRWIGRKRLHGQLTGHVCTRKEATELALLYGYTQEWSRNTLTFVMSRAARKRGIVSTDAGYLQRSAACGKNFWKNLGYAVDKSQRTV